MTIVDVSKLFRRDLLEMPPYTPSAVGLADMERLIKLDLNENPFGPSPRALAALAETRLWHRYASQDELRPAIAAYVGVAPEHIVVGNGADEVIDLLERIFMEPGDAILDCPPSFEMYRIFAQMNGARVLEVPRRTDFSLDVTAIERVATEFKPKLVFITSPSNPDGTICGREEIERLLTLPSVIVFDEAYAEFAGTSLAGRVPWQSNLVVLRTFSKWAALAGLRIGYAVAPKPIADQMLRTKPPYNVNAAAIVAARASLQDAEYLLANVRRIIVERERLAGALARVPFLEPLPSHTNFILCHVTGQDSRAIREFLAARGILIRAYSSVRMREYIRISVGTPEQDDILLQALAEIGAQMEREGAP